MHNRFAPPTLFLPFEIPHIAIFPSSSGRNQDGSPKLAAHFLPILGGPRVIYCALRNRVRINFPLIPIKTRGQFLHHFVFKLLHSPVCHISTHYYVIFSPFSFDPFSPPFSPPLFPLSLCRSPLSQYPASFGFPRFRRLLFLKPEGGGKTIKERGGGGSFFAMRGGAGFANYSIIPENTFLNICSAVYSTKSQKNYNNFSV